MTGFGVVIPTGTWSPWIPILVGLIQRAILVSLQMVAKTVAKTVAQTVAKTVAKTVSETVAKTVAKTVEKTVAKTVAKVYVLLTGGDAV